MFKMIALNTLWAPRSPKIFIRHHHQSYSASYTEEGIVCVSFSRHKPFFLSGLGSW